MEHDERTFELKKRPSPAVMRENLIRFSLFIAAFELLKDRLENRERATNQPKREKSKKKTKQKAARFDRLVQAKVLSEEDVLEFNQIKGDRNELVHNLTSYLDRGMPEFSNLFSRMIPLLDLVESCCAVGVEESDVDKAVFENTGKPPPTVLIVQSMLKTALGKDDQAVRFLEDFIGAAYD